VEYEAVRGANIADGFIVYHGCISGLFHGPRQITNDIPAYIHLARHTPAMCDYLMQRSHDATGRDSQRDAATFNSIAWQSLGEALRPLSIGQRIQLSKFMNGILPTLRRLQTFDNMTDGRCFKCGQLWEDTNHVL
jgi:hypothetical protein